MKVGILSMQQIKNYGSFLQAYALKSTIERLGHEVKFINIIKGEQIGDYKISKLHNLRQLIKRLNCKRPFENLKYTIKLHKRFDREFLPELGVYKGLVKDASKKCQKNPKKVLTKRERDGIIAKLSRETAALRKTA